MKRTSIPSLIIIVTLLLFSIVAKSRGAEKIEKAVGNSKTVGVARTDGVQIKTKASEKDGDVEFIKEVRGLCEELKKSPLKTKRPDDLKERKEILVLIKTLVQKIATTTDAKNAEKWKNYLMLDPLQKMLGTNESDLQAARNSLVAFDAKAPGLERPMFTPVREALRAFLNKQKRYQWTDQEKEDYRMVCEQFPKDLEDLLKKYDPDLAEISTISLAYLSSFEVDSSSCEKLEKLVLDRFSGANFMLRLSPVFFKGKKSQNFSENIKVSEVIRGSNVNGTGTVDGEISMSFVPNDTQAEIRVSLDAALTTRTSAVQSGVQVTSNNKGKIQAEKSIFLKDRLWTNPAVAHGQMSSDITGIYTSRVFGGGVIQQRVAQERPYSQAESQRRLEYRLTSRLNEEVNSGIAPAQKYLNSVFFETLRKNNLMPRIVSSNTTTENLYWSSLFATRYQLGLPLQSNQTRSFKGDTDLALLLHASCINNAAFKCFSGKRISDQELAKQFRAFAPQKKNDKTVSKANEKAPLWLTFSEDLPIELSFQKGVVTVRMSLIGFEREGKGYPELNIEVQYEIVPNSEGFVLRRKALDARPGDLKANEKIPARYQAIRTIVLGQLEENLQKEYAVKPILTGNGNGTKEGSRAPKGTLVPVILSAQDAWFQLEYKFIPEKEIKKVSK